MRKYLELTQGSFTQEHFAAQSIENQPYVAYSSSDQQVLYTEILKYLIFKSEQDNSTVGLNKLGSNQSLEYSTDATTWNVMSVSTTLSLNAGDKVYIRGMLTGTNTDSDYTQFKMSGKIAVYGNCGSLWNCKNPMANLTPYCGFRLFDGCTALTVAPDLPALVVPEAAYGRMFAGCTSLLEAPDLPATTLALMCYSTMFSGCSSLVKAPKVLPATSLEQQCYLSMFLNCASLTEAPELPAIQLKANCYYAMFAGTALSTAPKLPAEKLVTGCYRQMFQDCHNLNHVKCMATDISASNCTRFWLYGTASGGTFVKHPDMNDWTFGDHGVPSTWQIID